MSNPYSKNGRKPGTLMDVACKKCGAKERSAFGGKYFMCGACTDARVAQIRELAAAGLTQRDIGQRVGVSQGVIGTWCNDHGIKTKAMERPKAKPKERAPDPFRKPVQPSSLALRAVSIFNMGAA